MISNDDYDILGSTPSIGKDYLEHLDGIQTEQGNLAFSMSVFFAIVILIGMCYCLIIHDAVGVIACSIGVVSEVACALWTYNAEKKEKAKNKG